jgi:hypothetical protein
MFGCLSANLRPLEFSRVELSCSLSLGERVRVRGTGLEGHLSPEQIAEGLNWRGISNRRRRLWLPTRRKLGNLNEP